jgi:uncharacterized membrane protein YoaK (UPF0700 family)
MLPRITGSIPSGQGGMNPADRIPLGLPVQIVLGVLLTAAAGFVDAIGYNGLGGLFASFMSGASVSLGVGLGDGHWGAVQQGLVMIASFLGGVTLGTVLTGVAGAWALSSRWTFPYFLSISPAILAWPTAKPWRRPDQRGDARSGGRHDPAGAGQQGA